MNSILDWLEASAQRVPANLAFADVETQLTFEELQLRAQRVGSFLAARTQECKPVALYLEKSTLAITGMMGAVYARNCYCVLDVRQPQARLESIMSTLAPEVVLTDVKWEESARELLGGFGAEIVCVESLVEGAVDDELLAQRRARALDTDPLYINFTSGSTGTPKGVVVGHRSVLDFIPHFVQIFEISEADRIANQAPFDFDVSVKDIYSGLFTGAAVHMIPREYFSEPVKLMDFLVEREVTVCTWAVSAMCFVSIMGGFEYKVPTTIRRVMFSGEVMPPKQLNKWRSFLPDAQFANVYGPTEITCNCLYYIIDRDFGKDEVIPAGKAFPNEKVFLLGENDELVDAPGEEGEICVGGSTLALGYCNDPEKTAAAFVQNPLNKGYLETIYRTGDLGMWDEDGNMVYAGRKDHQIKHMGQRIELGEIDAVTQGHDAVTRACCIYNAKKKRIMLFYTGTCEKEELAEYLAEKLPQYMTPNKTFHLDEMPLTKNGKIDRRALEELGNTRKRRA